MAPPSHDLWPKRVHSKGFESGCLSRFTCLHPITTQSVGGEGNWSPEKDIGIQKIKKTSFGLEVSVI
jgi:hypothetical protein